MKENIYYHEGAKVTKGDLSTIFVVQSACTLALQGRSNNNKKCHIIKSTNDRHKWIAHDWV